MYRPFQTTSYLGYWQHIQCCRSGFKTSPRRATCMPASSPYDTKTSSGEFLSPTQATSSLEFSLAINPRAPSDVRSSIMSGLAVMWVLGGTPAATSQESQPGFPMTSYTVVAYSDRRRWTWRQIRAFTIAILE